MSGPGGPPNNFGQGYGAQRPPKPRFNFKQKTSQGREVTPDLMAQQLASFGTTAKQRPAMMNQQPGYPVQQMYQANTLPGNQMFQGMPQQQMFAQPNMYQQPIRGQHTGHMTSNNQSQIYQQQRFPQSQTMTYGQYNQQSFQPATFSNQPMRNAGPAQRKGSIGSVGALGTPQSAVGMPPSNNFGNAVGNPPSAVGLPPSVIGNPPSAIGNPPSALGKPPSAVGLPPSAVGLPPSSSAIGTPSFGSQQSSFNNQSSAMGLPPTSAQNNFNSFGTSNFGMNQSLSGQNFVMNQPPSGTNFTMNNNSLNFNNMTSKPQQPAFAQQSIGGLSGDMFDMFSSSRTQTAAAAPDDDPFLSLRNRKGSSNSLSSNGSNKPDMFGATPFVPQASAPNSVFSSSSTTFNTSATPALTSFSSFPTPAATSSVFNTPSTFNSLSTPAPTNNISTTFHSAPGSTKPATSTDMFSSTPSISSGFDMPPFNPSATPQSKPTDLFGSAPFVPAPSKAPVKISNTPFSSGTSDPFSSAAPGLDMFGSTPFTAQSGSDKFSAFDALSSAPDDKFSVFSSLSASTVTTFSQPPASSVGFSQPPVANQPTVSAAVFSQPTVEPAKDFGVFSQPPAETSTFTGFSQPPAQPDKFATFSQPSVNQSSDSFASFTQPASKPLDNVATLPASKLADSFGAFGTVTSPPANDKYSVFSELTSDEPAFDNFESTFPATSQLQALPGQLSKPPLPPKRPTSGPSIATPSVESSSFPAPFPTVSSPFAVTGNGLFDRSLLSGISTPPVTSAGIDLSIFDAAPAPTPGPQSISGFDQAPFDPFGAGSFAPDTTTAAPEPDNTAAFSAAFDSEPAFDPFASSATPAASAAAGSISTDAGTAPVVVDGRSRPTPAKKSTLLLLPPPAKPAPRGTAPKLPPKKPGPVKPPQPPRSYDVGDSKSPQRQDILDKKAPPKLPVRPSTKRQAPPPPSRPSTVKLPDSSAKPPAESGDLLSDLFSSTPAQAPAVNLMDDDLETLAPPLPKREAKSQPLLIMPSADPRTSQSQVPPPRPTSSPAITSPAISDDKYAAFKDAPEYTAAAPPLPPRPTHGHTLYHYIAQAGPHCVSNFDFEAEDSEELDFKAGDIIVLVSEISEEWFEGSVRGKTGMFPKNLVTVKKPLDESSSGPVFTPNPAFTATPEPTPEVPKKDILSAWDDVAPPSPPSTPTSSSSSEHLHTTTDSPTVLQSCIVLYDFEGAEGDELSLVEGQTVEITEFISEDWAKGRCEGREGMFPLGYVDLSTDNETLEPFLSDAPEESEELPPRPTFEELKTPSPEDPPTDTESPVLPRPEYSEAALVHRADSLILPSSESLSTEEKHVLLAEYDFEPEADDELQLYAGQEVEIVAIVDSEWLRGRAGESEGIFPAGFVPPLPLDWALPTVAEYLESLESDTDTMSLTSDVTSVMSEVETSSLDESGTVLGKGLVLLDFTPENDFELGLSKGDTVTVTGRLTETWLEGECNGATGIFPAEFIQWTEGGDELLANPCVTEMMAPAHKVFEREQTLTNDPEATPTKHDTITEEVTPRPHHEVTPRPHHGDTEELGPSFSSSNPFAELETSPTADTRYSMLKPNNADYGAEPDMYAALDDYRAEPDAYSALEPGLFASTENPFTSPSTVVTEDPFITSAATDDPFPKGPVEDPFSQQTETDPFSKGDADHDPFAKAETDPFAKSEDPFQEEDDPFKQTEDPFAKEVPDPFNNEKTEDPFKNNNTQDPFLNKDQDPFNNNSPDPFSKTEEDPFSGSQFGAEDPFKENEDPFCSLPAHDVGAKGLYTMRALYAFEPDNDDELAFTEGDLIEIIEEVNEEWLIGKCKGSEGLFPAAFAERVA